MVSTSQLAAYLRIAAYAIALFEYIFSCALRVRGLLHTHSYLQSLPAEYRLYAKQRGPLNLSFVHCVGVACVACILFILVRYLGVTSLVVGCVGFFHHGFSQEACDKFFWLAPVFKRMHATLLFLWSGYSHIIDSVPLPRLTVDPGSPNVCGIAQVADDPIYSRCLVCGVRVGRVHFDILEAHSRLDQRKRTASDVGPAAQAGTFQASKWLPYIMLVALVASPRSRVFDVVTMGITAAYLWKFSNTNRASISRLTRMMLEDGIMYFIALSGRFDVLGSASLGYAATMIFSSRFVLNLSERSRDGVSGEHSRTPASGGGRRVVNQMGGTASEGPELIVTVVKNVITMRDMSPDDEMARQVKGERWGTEDGNSMKHADLDDHRNADGALVQLEVESLACACKIKVNEPLPEYRDECPSVLVVVRGTHHRPIPFPAKTPPSIKEEILRLLPRFQEDLPDLTPRRFLRHPITKSYLSEKFPKEWNPTLSDLHISLANRSHLKAFIDQVRKGLFSCGTGWKGVLHLWGQQSITRPLKDQYIRRVIDLDCSAFPSHPEDESGKSAGPVRLQFVICMGREGSERLLQTPYLQSDIGFKRVLGFYEFELAGWDRDAHTTVVFCRIFLNRQTAVAHQKIFEAIDQIVDDYDGKILQWGADQHGGQAKGLGLYLQALAQKFPDKMDLHEPGRLLASLTPYEHLSPPFISSKCKVDYRVKQLMRSLVYWVHDKERSHFAFEGMCWAKSFIPEDVWKAGERTSVHCTLLGGIMIIGVEKVGICAIFGRKMGVGLGLHNDKGSSKRGFGTLTGTIAVCNKLGIRRTFILTVGTEFPTPK
ncbi:hypothetical protein B0H11DRAFT_2303387 [Mycena galericulata]|nr:hypothetical protein B0H11DRAFT_2303387 [Mycena galericulata]